MADHIIEVRVDDKIATVVGDPLYVCGNSDYIVRFSFDAEWSEHDAKTARFIKTNKEYVDVPFIGNQCAVPILENTLQVRIGVYAGNLCTTTPAIVNAQRSILCGAGTPVDPPDDVYNQLMLKLNEIAQSGIKGEAGEIAGVTATVDNDTGTPSVDVSLGGTGSARTIDLAFKNLKGEKGDKGDTSYDAKTLDGKPPSYYVQPRNLLVNGYFATPVNQRGVVAGTVYNSEKYFLDRWRVTFGRTVTINSFDKTGITFENGSGFLQRVTGIAEGTPLTFAVCMGDGTILCVSGTCMYNGSYQTIKDNADDSVADVWLNTRGDEATGFVEACIIFKNGARTIRWAALYEGTYTAETLPPYVSKGYAEELVECQRRCHVYETESARPSKPLDCSPHMTLAAGTTALTQGTLTVDGKTLYYNSTDL